MKVHYPVLDEDKRWSLRFTDGEGAPLHLIRAVDGWCDMADGTVEWVYAGTLSVADITQTRRFTVFLVRENASQVPHSEPRK